MKELGELRADFYVAMSNGHRRKAHLIARKLLAAADGAERARWRRWVDATRRGHDVRFSTFPTEVIAGEDLQALDELRAANTPADLVEEA